jgi:hypothetical protein
MHGLEHIIEAFRQVYGESTMQAEGAEVSMIMAGPLAPSINGCTFAITNTL